MLETEINADILRIGASGLASSIGGEIKKLRSVWFLSFGV